MYQSHSSQSNQPNQPFSQQSSSFYPQPNTSSPQQFGGGGSSNWGNNSPSVRGNNSHNGGYNNSPFNQSYGGGGAQGTGGNGALPSAFGEKQKTNYLPGYLSGGAMGGQSEAAPPSHDDSRSWDSPASRASISGGSPINRFGNQSLFGGRDATPSRSPQTSQYIQKPRTTTNVYRTEIDEEAPPVESLTEFDVGNDSMTSIASESAYDTNRRPGLPSTSSSSLKSTTQSPPGGYSVNLFGFPSTSLPIVLEYFTQFGEILSTNPSTAGGNWVTISYSQAWSAARAARKNGTIIGGILMVGVSLLDEEAVRSGLGSSGGIDGLNGLGAIATGGGESNTSSRPSTPARGPPSGVGKPIQVLGASSAFRSAAPTPPRRGFFGGVGGGGGGDAAQAGLFAEKNRQSGMQEEEKSKGVLGKVSDMVFGW